MPQMTMVQAIQDALRLALREDPRVVVLGEDVGLNGAVSGGPDAPDDHGHLGHRDLRRRREGAAA